MDKEDIERIIASQGLAVQFDEFAIDGIETPTYIYAYVPRRGIGRTEGRRRLGKLTDIAEMDEADLVQLIVTKFDSQDITLNRIKEGTQEISNFLIAEINGEQISANAATDDVFQEYMDLNVIYQIIWRVSLI